MSVVSRQDHSHPASRRRRGCAGSRSPVPRSWHHGPPPRAAAAGCGMRCARRASARCRRRRWPTGPRPVPAVAARRCSVHAHGVDAILGRGPPDLGRLSGEAQGWVTRRANGSHSVEGRSAQARAHPSQPAQNDDLGTLTRNASTPPREGATTEPSLTPDR